MRGKVSKTEGRWIRTAWLGSVIAVVLAGRLSGADVAQAQAFLGTAQSFAVLGGSTVTNTGPSVIDGDLGVWPGLAITGFPPGTVVPPGVIHAGDAVAQQAQNDVTTAYNTLAGMACNTDLTGQNLGGLTLTPGVYCFSTVAQLTGNLTLDAQGDDQAVFIFQIGSTLTTATNASVNVINSGQDCNVSWQVGRSATLGTATAFVGNILALTSITLNTTASLSGRALARNGAVTLDNNAVTVPTCALAPTATNTTGPSPTSTVTRTSTPGPSPTASNTVTPTPLPTSTFTPSPGPSPTPTRTPTPTPLPTSTFTPSPGPSPTSTFTPSPGPSPTRTRTPVPAFTPGSVGGLGAGTIRAAKAADHGLPGSGRMPSFALIAMVLGVVAVAGGAVVVRARGSGARGG